MAKQTGAKTMVNHSLDNTGALVISLDFELMWGIIDSASKTGYGETNVRQVPLVIDRLLELFCKYEVHATFATVGMIMYNGRNELLDDLPSMNHPSYSHNEMSPYENDYISTILPNEEALFFQLELVRKIKMTMGMEIGTHTYCHFYCWEPGQTIEQFEEDIKKAVSVASARNLTLKSIVFPRNNVSPDYLSICARYGITSYRGNAKKYYNKTTNRIATYWNRLCRFWDSYIDIGGSSSYSYDEIDIEHVPMNIPASRFVRPYSSRLRFIDGLKLRRIRRELTHAAKNNELYHLWWHPHNFGMNTEENLRFLEEILKTYQDCHAQFGMQSFTMDEFRNYLINPK